MKLRSEDNFVLSNSTHEKKFTIAASAKAFQILSSALYSRKIEAIVRELSCNAYDSHVFAGCPELPFSVKLPTSWEPEFSIEDFGLGLSDVEVETVYTSYFTSTKTESNDVIGGLGLGSKTPFAYTDSFNIRSRKNGTEWVYNAFINASGEPSVSLIASNKTTEPNGVKVTVPVRDEDFWQFRQDAVKVYSWFKTVPNISDDSIEVDNRKVAELDERGFVTEDDQYSASDVTVVMGNVAYFVKDVRAMFNLQFNPAELTFLKNNSLTIRFDIGDLDVAASRETISFDEETTRVFVARIKDIIESSTRDTQIKIDNEATCITDAMRIADDEIGAWAYSLFTFQGADLDALASHNIFELIDHISDAVKHDYWKYNNNRRTRVIRLPRPVWNNITFKDVQSKKIVFVEQDVDKSSGMQKQSKRLVEEYKKDAYMVMNTHRLLTDRERNALRTEFGEANLDFRLLTDLIEEDRLERKQAREEYLASLPEKERAVKAAPAPRIKKDQLRCIDVDNYQEEHEKRDISLFSDAKTLVIVSSRGSCTFTYQTVTYTYAQMMKLALGMDKAIIVKERELDRVKKLLPQSHVLAFSTVKDNVDAKFVFDIEMISSYVLDVANTTPIDLIKKTFYPYKNLPYKLEEWIGNTQMFNTAKEIVDRISSYPKEMHYATLPHRVKNFVPGTFVWENPLLSYQGDFELAVEGYLAAYPMLKWLDHETPKELLDEYIEMQNARLQLDNNDIELVNYETQQDEAA